MRKSKPLIELEKERAAARRRRKVYRLKNHPFVVPVTTFVVLTFLTLVGMVALSGRPLTATDSHVVRLSIGGKLQIVPTRAKTVGDLLQRTKITLNEGDIVEPAQDTEILDDNFRVNIYRAWPVTIVDGDKRVQTLSAATSPRSVVAQAGFQVYPEDNVSVSGSDSILREGVLGQKVVIDRATPVYLNLYGTAISLRTHARTVEQLIKEKNINLAAGETVQPALTTPLTSNAQIFVLRSGSQIASIEENIPMPIEYVDDANLSFGTTALRQKGSAGKKVTTYLIESKDGKEVSRKVIQEITATPVVKQIIARGKAVYVPADKSAWMAAAGISTGDYPYVQYIINHENALWCPTRWQGQRTCPAFYEEIYPGAENAGIGYGLCQSTPGSKMSTAGADWRVNAVTQLKWCSGYAKSRYGGWAAAYEHWIAYNNW